MAENELQIFYKELGNIQDMSKENLEEFINNKTFEILKIFRDLDEENIVNASQTQFLKQAYESLKPYEIPPFKKKSHKKFYDDKEVNKVIDNGKIEPDALIFIINAYKEKFKDVPLFKLILDSIGFYLLSDTRGGFPTQKQISAASELATIAALFIASVPLIRYFTKKREDTKKSTLKEFEKIVLVMSLGVAFITGVVIPNFFDFIEDPKKYVGKQWERVSAIVDYAGSSFKTIIDILGKGASVGKKVFSYAKDTTNYVLDLPNRVETLVEKMQGGMPRPDIMGSSDYTDHEDVHKGGSPYVIAPLLGESVIGSNERFLQAVLCVVIVLLTFFLINQIVKIRRSYKCPQVNLVKLTTF